MPISRSANMVIWCVVPVLALSSSVVVFMDLRYRLPDARDVGQPWHGPSVFVPFDETGKIPAIVEQQRRCRRGGPYVETGHRAEEFHARNPLGCWENRRQSVDEANGNVVAIDHYNV